MKKVISLVMALCMLVSAMSAFGKIYVPDTMPEVGVLIKEDFSGYADIIAARGTASAPNGTWFIGSSGQILNEAWSDIGGGQYIAHDMNALGISGDFASGKLKIEYKTKIPKGTDLADGAKNNTYMCTWSESAWNGASTNKGYHGSSVYKNDAPAIAFSALAPMEGAAALEDNANGTPKNYKIVEFDKWYTVTSIIDYDAKTADYYVDGEHIVEFLGDKGKFNAAYAFRWIQISHEGTNNTNILIDDLLVERLGDDDVTAKVSEVGANYADIKFDTTVVKNDTYTASNFLLKKLDGSAAVSASSVTKLAADTFRVTFADNFASGTNYEIIVNADVAEAGTENIMPKGTKVLFATSASGAQTLIDINFNDKENHFATADNSADFDLYYYQSKSDTDTSTAFVTQKDLTDDHATVTSRGDGETGTNFRILNFKHLGTDPDYKSLVFPFADNTKIADGKLTIEFEAMIDGTDKVVTNSYETAYGLRDIKNTAKEFDYASTWADATMFAGHERWSIKQMDLTPALVGKRGKPSTWYGGPAVVAGAQASDWKDAHRLVKFDYLNKNNYTEMDKYKIVVDLDKDIFEIYCNNTLYFTSDYMPGGINDGEYDAFVLASVHGNSDLPGYFYMDNLKVTHEAPVAEAFEVEGAAFEVDGKTVAYGSAVDFAANKMTITMSEEVSAAGVENYVKFSGSDDYTVSADGNVITLDFANGLTYGTDYTVTLSSELAAASGTKLGQNIVLSFEAVVGDITYGTPVVALGEYTLTNPSAVQADDTLTVTVNAKAGVSCSATIILAAYSNGQLADVAHQTVTSDSGVLEFVYTASEKFAGAEVVKAFVFDNLTSITPLAANFSAGE